MNPGEHEIMSRVEERHWWYQGLRDALARTLADAALPERPRILDAGCGTGQNLRFLSERLDPGYLGGFDLSEEALAFTRSKVPGADLYVGDICQPQIHPDELDMVISMDVVYVPGTERALPGLRRLVSRLSPGGLFVVNLPAYRWLYSHHDVAIHTSQRFTAGEVRGLLENLGLTVDLLTYRLCLIFPLVVLKRLPGMLRSSPGDETVKSDLHAIPGEFTNRALFSALRLENALIARGVRFPWGSSVFAVGRKPGR